MVFSTLNEMICCEFSWEIPRQAIDDKIKKVSGRNIDAMTHFFGMLYANQCSGVWYETGNYGSWVLMT